ncbi:aldo/keto reductase [Lewinella sp. LCG006]|uniref:aldo/keto reductase n=1 Tax=Lewinella sp. LCG006 TaxID=3231911 RepID=UPI003460982A
MMDFSLLGSSTLNISRIALGGMSFPSVEMGQKIIQTALEGGINLFDTADLYDKGDNERIVGKALATIRQEVFIATKVGNRWRADGSGWDWVPRKAYIMTAVEASLERLGTDYIDLYQLHGGTIEDPLEEVVEAFELLKDQGKIRAYGISSIRPNTIRKWTALSQGVSCMSQYSLLDRRPEEFVLGHLQQAGHGILVRGALAKGLLAGRPAQSYLDHSADQVANVQAEMLKQVNKEDLPGLALAYCLRSPAVASVVLGASQPDQISSALAAWQRVNAQDINFPQLAEAVPFYDYTQHR